MVTSSVVAAFSGTSVSLSATVKAAVCAVLNVSCLSLSALLYLSETFTSLAFVTNPCKISIFLSKSFASSTIPSINVLSLVSLTKSLYLFFWALFKCDKFSITLTAVSRVAFACASSTILSNWFFDVALSISDLYCSLSSLDNPGIWSIFFLYSSFSFSASASAFFASFVDFWFSASFTIASTSSTVVASPILRL